MIDFSYFSSCIALKERVLSEPLRDRRLEILEEVVDVHILFHAHEWFEEAFHHLSLDEKIVLLSAIFFDRGALFPRSPIDHNPIFAKHLFIECMSILLEVDRFYESIGGLVGYHVAVITNIYRNQNHLPLNQDAPFIEFMSPPYLDMREKSAEYWHNVYSGVHSLGLITEFHAVGGAGDRLNLIDPTTCEPKPAANLIIFGKSLLEWLFDDIDGREYFSWQVTSKRVTIPVVLMTSLEKKNDIEIESLCIANNWFSRDPETVFRVIQPLAPLVDTDGYLVAKEYFQPALKPGGHGVIWKIAEDFGVYERLQKEKISSILVRQINNPLSGMDGALLALPGQGIREKKVFGFASCPMKEGFHEGLNVLQKRVDGPLIEYSLSNIEYVVFETLKKSDPEIFSGACPANVNLLYADIDAIVKASHNTPFPGLIVNMKNEVDAIDEHGSNSPKKAARLESTMQNISEEFRLMLQDQEGPLVDMLPSFIQLYDRIQILSVTKRAFHSTSDSFHETPISFMYDWVLSTRILLNSFCSTTLPDSRGSITEFLRLGPEFLFTFHPSLGPLWEVIGQKIMRNRIAEGTALHVGLSEIFMADCLIDGTLSMRALLPVQQQIGLNRRPKVYLQNVRIINDARVLPKNCGFVDVIQLIQRGVSQDTGCQIVLEGSAQIWAENITISGPFSLYVPDKMRAVLEQEGEDKVTVIFEPITDSKKNWDYTLSWKSGEKPIYRRCEVS